MIAVLTFGWGPVRVDFGSVVKGFLAWYAGLMLHFARTAPRMLFNVVAAYGIARVTSLLSFFVPFKVILLAASPGVPSYFPFIAPEYKAHWIAGFALLAFGLYLLTLVLDADAERLSGKVGKQLMAHAEKLVVTGEMEASAGSNFMIAARVASNVIFFAVSLLVLVVASGSLVLAVLAAIAGLYLFTVAVLSGNPLSPSRLHLFVVDRLHTYLQSLVAVVFFAGFVALLWPFIEGDGDNLLLVILAITLLRQALSALTTMVVDAVGLHRNRVRIDGLFRRDTQLHRPKPVAGDVLLHALRPAGRLQLGMRALLSAGVEHDAASVRVAWFDADHPHVKKLVVRRSGSSETAFLLRLFTRPARVLLESESILFAHVEPAALGAPPLLTRLKDPSFVCTLSEYGAGAIPSAEQWPHAKRSHLKAVWSYAVPQRLIDVYASTHPLLHQRLTVAQIERMRVAVDNEADDSMILRLVEALPALQDRLARLPVYVYNPNFWSPTSVLDLNGGLLVTDWWNWSVEPLGGGKNHRAELDVLIEYLPELKRLRSDVPADLTADDVRLACEAQFFEEQLSADRFKGALATAGSIIALLKK